LNSFTRSAVLATVFERPLELAKSASLRLGLLHAGLFATAGLALFALTYSTTANVIAEQVDGGIEAELSSLSSLASTQGSGALASTIRRIAREPLETKDFYLLQDPRGDRVAGNLPQLSPTEGWLDLPFPPNRRHDKQRQHRIHAKGVVLVDGSYLIVGRDTHDFNELRERIVRTFALSFGATIALALLTSLVLSARMRRRVAAINQVMRQVEDGNLSQRLTIGDGNTELEELARHLNTMLDQLQRVVEDLRQVSNDIAHDLRTPLSRLRQNLELAQLKARDRADYEAAIERAISETDDVLATFSSLLRIAQIEAGARRANFAGVDLSGLVDNICDAFAPVAEDNGQRLRSDIAHDVAVLGDRELLTQMFANLVENALRHTRKGTEISISLRRDEGIAVASIADHGPGIPADLRQNVLKRFVRLDRSRGTPGNGLGLSLVAAIAELHEIALELGDNRPGLRVALRFPRQASASDGSIATVIPEFVQAAADR
jgi:signal transduction histidine kinase